MRYPEQSDRALWTDIIGLFDRLALSDHPTGIRAMINLAAALTAPRSAFFETVCPIAWGPRRHAPLAVDGERR